MGESDTAVSSDVSSCTGWKNGARIAVKIPDARILHYLAAYFLIKGNPVAEIAGQNKADYDKKKFHAVLLGKTTPSETPGAQAFKGSGCDGIH